MASIPWRNTELLCRYHQKCRNNLGWYLMRREWRALMMTVVLKKNRMARPRVSPMCKRPVAAIIRRREASPSLPTRSLSTRRRRS